MLLFIVSQAEKWSFYHSGLHLPNRIFPIIYRICIRPSLALFFSPHSINNFLSFPSSLTSIKTCESQRFLYFPSFFFYKLLSLFLYFYYIFNDPFARKVRFSPVEWITFYYYDLQLKPADGIFFFFFSRESSRNVQVCGNQFFFFLSSFSFFKFRKKKSKEMIY